MRSSAERLRHGARFAGLARKENPASSHSTDLRGIPLTIACDVQKHADTSPPAGVGIARLRDMAGRNAHQYPSSSKASGKDWRARSTLMTSRAS